MKLRTILPLLVLLASGGCASSPPAPDYRPYADGQGYSEARLTPTQWQIWYEGDRGMSAGRALELATVRAADLARRRDCSFIEVVASNVRFRTKSYYREPWTSRESFEDSEGQRHYYERLISPGEMRIWEVPVAAVTVRLLEEQTSASLTATDVIAGAWDRRIIPPTTTRPASEALAAQQNAAILE